MNVPVKEKCSADLQGLARMSPTAEQVCSSGFLAERWGRFTPYRKGFSYRPIVGHLDENNSNMSSVPSGQ